MVEMEEAQGQQAEKGEREESLWERVLAEHRENSSAAKARDVYELFVGGDSFDGKDAVLKWLRQGSGDDDDDEEEAAPCGLSFGFGEWKEKPVGEDEESTIRILQTIIQRPSLQFLFPAYFLSGSMGPRVLETSVFAITVDLSIPHCAMKKLDAWYTFYEKTIKEVCGDELDLPRRLAEKMEDQCTDFHTERTPVPKKQEADECLEVISSPRDMGRSTATYKKMGIFTKGNLGVPLIVIGTKAKLLDAVAQSYTKDPKEKDHFLNYIMATLRKWCIERGACLIYTDGDRAASDVLKEYLLYRLANVPMSTMLDDRRMVTRRTPGATISHTKCFIPAFADSLPQVAKLQLGKFADASWETVVPAPKAAAAAADDSGTEPPDKFDKWLEKEKRKVNEGGFLGSNFATAATTRTPIVPRPKTKPSDRSLEATAESFFKDLIKTYKRQDGPSTRHRTGTASGSPPAAPSKS